MDTRCPTCGAADAREPCLRCGHRRPALDLRASLWVGLGLVTVEVLGWVRHPFGYGWLVALLGVTVALTTVLVDRNVRRALGPPSRPSASGRNPTDEVVVERACRCGASVEVRLPVALSDVCDAVPCAACGASRVPWSRAGLGRPMIGLLACVVLGLLGVGADEEWTALAVGLGGVSFVLGLARWFRFRRRLVAAQTAGLCVLGTAAPYR